VTGEHRHPYTGAGDGEVSDLKDLATLVAKLLLLVSLA
jgi:hypothetical protein